MILDRKIPRTLLPLTRPARYKGIFGGRGCVHPDTLIDTPKGQIKVSEFNGGNVFSWDNGNIVIAKATKSKAYTKENLFKVEFDDGRSIIVTDEHKFLTPDGWKMLSSLSQGDDVVLLHPIFSASLQRTSSGISRKESRASVQHYFQKDANYQDDCLRYFHQCDRQPQEQLSIARSFPLLQDDAQQHILRALSVMDVLDIFCKDSLLLSLCHPSTLAAHAANVGKYYVRLENCNAGKTFERLSVFFRSLLKFPKKFSHSVLETILNLPRLCLDIQKSQDESQGMLFGRLLNNDLYKISCEKTPNEECFILSKIRLITYHSHQIYWDLHVYGTNNYLSNGIVNHNSGKSHDRAEALIERCATKKTDAVCIREIQKSLNQSVKKLLETKIESLGVGHLFEVQESCIKGNNGSLIIFQGMQNHTADSIKSLEGYDVAWVEEAQSLSQRSLDLLRPTIRKEGSEIWFTWNPNLESDPVDVFLRGKKPPDDSIIIEANYMDNPWLPDVLLAEMEYDKRRDPDKYAHVWLGKYLQNSEARVFKNWRVEEFDAPDGTVFQFGADWGYAIDPSVLVRCYMQGRNLYIDYEAYQIGCEITNLPALFMSVPGAENWFIVADSSRPETISYMQQNGFPRMTAAVKGVGSIEEGIQFLQSYDIIVHPRCKHTIDELSTYSYKVDKLTDQVTPYLSDKNNHVIDSLRYACESARRFQKAHNSAGHHEEEPPPDWRL